MSRITKLYVAALANPGGLSFREFERLLAAFGFIMLRQRGSHRSFQHPGGGDLLVVQPRKAAAKAYQVKQFLDIVTALALTVDD